MKNAVKRDKQVATESMDQMDNCASYAIAYLV
jgi:hypothetical protein